MLPAYNSHDPNLKFMAKKGNSYSPTSVAFKQLFSMISNKTKTIQGLINNWEGVSKNSNVKLDKTYWRRITHSEDPNFRIRRFVGMNRSGEYNRSQSLIKPIAKKASKLIIKRNNNIPIELKKDERSDWKQQAKLFCTTKITNIPLIEKKKSSNNKLFKSFCNMKEMILPKIKEKCIKGSLKIIDMQMWNIKLK